MTSFAPSCQTTGIGSLPMTDARAACELVLASADIPFWPQLPQRDFRESMNAQYSEGMPGARIDLDAKRLWFEVDETLSVHVAEFYERYMEQEDEGWPISREYAAGLYEFLDLISDQRFPCLKAHVTGPLTFAFGVTDQERRAAYYNPELFDPIVKCLAQKAVWQARRLQPLADAVLVFVDEPVLAAFGTSAYLSLTAQDVQAALNECFEAIHRAGALAGVHCCGNTEWEMLTGTEVDVVSFDAYQYARSLSLYADSVEAFLERGGVLAWGVVPTNEAVREETVESLSQRLLDGFALLEAKGVERGVLARQALLTPSCGAGTMEEDDARRVFELLAELGGWARENLGA